MSTHGTALRLGMWTLPRIAAAVDGELLGATGAESTSRLSTDTRDIEEGSIFVALVGERFDAHDFVGDAFEKGAVAAIVHESSVAKAMNAPTILVEDTLVALQALGHAIWQEATEAGMRTVALTGSNGKTTVKEMAAALLSGVGETFATPGNLNNHIGVPLTLCALPERIEFLVLEMGANGPGDIDELIAIAPGQTRVITSIGAAHLEGFGDLDGVRRGKSEIFGRSARGDVAIVPFAERSRLVLDEFSGEVLTVGEASEADIELCDFDPRGGRPVARYDVDGRTVTFDLPIPGRHHAHNLGTALAVTVAEGLELDEGPAQAALDSLVLPGGRWREQSIGDIRIIDDAYNANPTSTVASFEAFVQIKDPRPRVAVLGEMLELGGSARSEHVDVARRVAKGGALQTLVAVGPYADDMADAASEFVEALAFSTAAEVGDWLAGRASKSDGLLVFLKGSRGARLEDVIERTREVADEDRNETR